MIATLHDPEGDKNWSVHFNELLHIERSGIKILFNALTYPSCDSNWKNCNPFLQGYSDDWIMIEFWTDDIEDIIKGCKYLENVLKVKIKGL